MIDREWSSEDERIEAGAELLIKLRNVLHEFLLNYRDPLLNVSTVLALAGYMIDMCLKNAPDHLREEVRKALIAQFENFCDLVSKGLEID